MKKTRGFNPKGTGEETLNTWVTTYSDMITNLMILFMILWAYTQFLQKTPGDPSLPKPVSVARQTLKEQIRKELEEVGAVAMTQKSVTITLPSAVLFAPGKADLKEEAKKNLARVSRILSHSTAPVVVEGFTDDSPIQRSGWRSNYELSAARSFNVIRFFVEQGLSPKRLTARGFGPFRPTVPNVSDENRARNRRIEIRLWL